jgi:hypothetical protein
VSDYVVVLDEAVTVTEVASTGPPGPPGQVALSFLRIFGPTTPTPIPANTVTPIPLTGASRQFGTANWQLIVPGDPDYGAWPGCLRCLVEGLYDWTGGVVYSTAQNAGDRAVAVATVVGQLAGYWKLVQSTTMTQRPDAGLLVSGEAYQFVGDIVQLQGWSSTSTATTANPQSEFLSVALIATP